MLGFSTLGDYFRTAKADLATYGVYLLLILQEVSLGGKLPDLTIFLQADCLPTMNEVEANGLASCLGLIPISSVN